MSVTLAFVAGTLEVRGWPEDGPPPPSSCILDPRTACLRAPALSYADIVRALVRDKIPYQDDARRYQELTHGVRVHREPRFYQAEAVKAWVQQRGRGVVVLPTGAGKTHVAVMAIEEKRRSALVLAPTLELVRQWYDLLRTTFDMPVGVVGGGQHEVHPLTVTTYDSAHIHMEHLGARFGLMVFDECHHLPGSSYSFAARLAIAPFRLGLTATPERADGRDSELTELIGPIVYHKDIVELSGEYLADYDTVRLTVELSEAERAEYEEARSIYKGFIVDQGIQMSSKRGWDEFIKRCARSPEGRQAMAMYRRQREIAFGAPGKIDVVEQLLAKHRKDRALLFTDDNATAYTVARRFLIPIITHQTKVRERSDILERFARGAYTAVVTSKVLNEGVDVPDANIAIVISGSGSIREHVQRLGRVLRKKGDKHATLYELVSANTTESYTSDRRREHSAYR